MSIIPFIKHSQTDVLWALMIIIVELEELVSRERDYGKT